ncbi:tRNA (adenosine(37)-N6)-dimethylallyltransferase MiaA [Planomicrobium sp. YIM 101495]|uniref:tRNA (adenosine(37)-N6)-dimethylallyltransferase MiaA n=1 Tax=Planomicrobium sp. YIM 101495 TaxID=2665160 RepID=UPI0012B8EC28|nr:tRNA (adenosine(37)-N6)-dimethylallyltransferase MiaA [Planomicrobium sp. YIM 101495]MTD30205.1 tRNA (adenosine(37)-N6)-dimethylallyltransferase MiaA [Planomicrobium sp. YIM 101495]
MDRVIAIVGPTASGKTALSVALAKRLDGEIINGDSMQVYRELSIGTAKIKPEEMKGIPHHLLDIRDPDESFSVADFQRLVREKISEITARGKLPIIVGGSGLYVQAVLFDYRFPDNKVDEELRNRLNEQLEEKGPLHMHAELMRFAPKVDIHPNNTRRVIRALEIAMSGDEQPNRQQGLEPLYDSTIIGLDIPRDVLYERINERVDAMVAEGLLEEVRGLHAKGLRDVQSVQAIGYKELYAYLDNRVELEEAYSKLKQNSRRYAKRQFTYFKNKLPIEWMDALEGTEHNIQKIIHILKDKESTCRKEVEVDKKELGR